MALLFIGLLVRGGIAEGLGSVGDGLISNLSLLFVPAGVGVMQHAKLIGSELVPISVALVVSKVRSSSRSTCAVNDSNAPLSPRLLFREAAFDDFPPLGPKTDFIERSQGVISIGISLSYFRP